MLIISPVRCVGFGRLILHESLHGVGFRGGVCRGSFGGVWSVGSAGNWANYWANFSPNVLSLSGFLWLKILSQKCLFLKSLVFRELAGCAEWALKKLKRRGRERKREKKRKRQKTKGERRKGRFFETWMFMNCSRIDHELIVWTRIFHDLFRINETINGH